VGAVGGWWDRTFSVEVDLVGADRATDAAVISFVGSVKWRVTPADRRDVEELRRGAAQVPGVDPATCGLVLASLSGRADGVDPESVDLWWGPGDIIRAWS
jgi:hypothetical protein